MVTKVSEPVSWVAERTRPTRPPLKGVEVGYRVRLTRYDRHGAAGGSR